ncbi:asparagine synthase (glutamine-hydrolyzing) [Desulfobacula sp.]|uniref:asparagine synthase (glutamine-hydrolyzing) n=1 Tax=Desulfobacula sp. TaxID=2593537 RepID=UPI0026068ECC|nr:asparagine synthase (glutamine-hydrolyzing) [Desulfobacula sp.]
MCGITGIFNFENKGIDADTLVRMTRTLFHRGPDEEGFFVNTQNAGLGTWNKEKVAWRYCSGQGNVGLGHRRLSIIDLATGQQPLCNEDGSIWITFNGEIYNFQELKRDLESKGHQFRTNSDTETIVHAYEEWGTNAIEKLRGMFAFAIWDENKKQLLLARDRVGKKPLYYLDDPKRLIFGSEIKAILEVKDVSRSVDYTALYDYLSLLYVPAPKTIFKSIKKLPAGHWAIVTADSIQVESYWDLSFYPDMNISESQMTDDLLNILDEATKIRMISEVPLGAFLSGGVDSSAIVALMAKRSSEPVKTNSISFSVAKYNEAQYAKKVADLFKTDHHEFHVTPEAVSVIEKLAWHYDEPFADSSAVPTYYVSEIARKNVTVSLSGDGGDENFAGYRRYYFDMRENFVRSLVPERLRQVVFGTIGNLYPKADYLPQVFRGKAFISNIARDPVDAYYFSVSSMYGQEKRQLVHPDILNEIGDYRTRDLFYDIYKKAPAKDHLSKIQYLDIKTYLCDDILTKVDRASMAVSLEVRCPILDHVFMEYVAKIPSKYKLVGKDGKYIFKKTLKKYLPDDILYRKKMGFGVPVEEWLRKDLKEYGGNLVLKGEASKLYLQKNMLDKFWSEHQKGLRNRSTELWIIMMLNLWHRDFAV